MDPDLIDELRLAVTRLERKLRKGSGAGGVTPSQYSALFVLSRHGPLRLGELARREQISKSTTTRLVAGLESRSLIQRTGDEADARSAIVGLTEQGRALMAEIAEGSNDYLRQRLDALSSAELARLTDAVGILTRLAHRA